MTYPLSAIEGLSAYHASKLKSLGMALAVDPTDTQWRTTLKSFLGSRKVNLVIDNIVGALFNDLLATLADHGRVSVVGRLARAWLRHDEGPPLGGGGEDAEVAHGVESGRRHERDQAAQERQRVEVDGDRAVTGTAS